MLEKTEGTIENGQSRNTDNNKYKTETKKNNSTKNYNDEPRTTLKSGCERRCSGRVGSSCLS